MRREEREYRTIKPIDDEMAALTWLMPALSRHEHRFLVTRDDDDPPTIHLEGWGGGEAQMEYTGSSYYAVEPALAQKLIDSGLLQKLGRCALIGWEPDRTYTLDLRAAYARMSELALVRYEELRPLLKPGEHSAWCSHFKPDGFGWLNSKDDHWVGRLCFDFKTPAGDHVRIFYDTREIVQIDRDRSDPPE